METVRAAATPNPQEEVKRVFSLTVLSTNSSPHRVPCTPSLSRPEGSWISAPTHPLPNSGTWLPCFPASSGAEIPPTTYSTDPGTNATSSRKLAQTPRRPWSFLYGSDCIPDFCPKWYQSVVPQTESSLGPETSLNLLRSPAGARHVADSKAVQAPHQSG